MKPATKVDVPNSQHNINQEINIEWYSCGIHVWLSKWTPKEMRSKETGLRAQNMLTILGSTLIMIEWVYVTIGEHENLHFDNE